MSAVNVPPPSSSSTTQRAPVHLLAAGAPALVAFVVYCVFSIARHERFGSGSWDMGCYVHNLFILAHGLPPVSSVLGDASFWGGTNHFMPSLYLAAPLAWTRWTASLLVLQAALVAAAAIPLALLAKRRGLGPLAVGGVSLAYLFAVGTQSMIEFDVHEIAPVPLCLFIALLALDHGPHAKPRAVAYVALVVMAGCKESAILYAAAVGLWLAATTRGRRLEGLAIFAVLAAWFYVVTAVIQPAFLEEGARMIHVARFKQLGADPAEIVKHIALHPLDTFGHLFSPAPKAQTIAVTTGGFAFLPLLSPTSWLLAAPNLAERFLSDKREMWGLGFHYSLVLVACWAYGAVDALARVLPSLTAALARRTTASRAPRALDAGAGALLALACIASNAAAPFPPELSTVQKPYMAAPDEVDRYRRALAVIPDDASVVAQNHFLPHLAFRQHIWLPEDRFLARADYAILDDRASPWPQTSTHVIAMLAKLRMDPTWTIAFEEASTVVFKRAPPASDETTTSAPVDRTPP